MTTALRVRLFVAASVLAAGIPGEAGSRPRNVVLMIGDGMGLGQVTAGAVAAGSSSLERCPVVGLAKTGAANALVTDSAAAATAMASGVKTTNGVIGMDAQQRPVTTLLELAERKSLRTGLVVTCTITHATPAAFVAHQPSREMDEAIAADLVASGVDVFIGGGRRFFRARRDGRNLLGELTRRGYAVFEDLAHLSEARSVPLAGLVAEGHLPRMSEGRGNYLERATETALRLLGGGKGFFLMVEGSQIDWGSHENDTAYLVAETVDFDRAVGRVLDFARRDGQTLVVITADHETGGLAIPGGDLAAGKVEGAFTTKEHTGSWVPVFAYGPGAEAFAGVYENTAIFGKVQAALGLGRGGVLRAQERER